jgi:hypothetical protein
MQSISKQCKCSIFPVVDHGVKSQYSLDRPWSYFRDFTVNNHLDISSKYIVKI